MGSHRGPIGSMLTTADSIAEAKELAEWVAGYRDAYSPARPNPHDREEILAIALLISLELVQLVERLRYYPLMQEHPSLPSVAEVDEVLGRVKS